jgi:putative DNA primase/helicase
VITIPPRPARPPEPQWPNFPPKLKVRKQWVNWIYRFVNGRWTKVPCEPDGSLASVTDPATWSPYEFVESAYYSVDDGEIPFDGVGYVLTGDNITVFDFDHCRNPATGEIDPLILSYVTRLDSYVEISPSQSGLRLIVEAKLPPKYRRAGTIEMYDNARFVSITGHTL